MWCLFMERICNGCKLNLRCARCSVSACRWRLPSGPYGLLFSCFVPFALEVPPLHRFQLFGLRLTDKASCVLYAWPLCDI